MERANEPLVLRSLEGSKGYLKLPRKFTFEHMQGLNAKNLPDPNAFIDETDDKIKLIYEFDKKEMEDARNTD